MFRVFASALAPLSLGAAVDPTRVEIAPNVFMPYVNDGIIFDLNCTGLNCKEIDGLHK